MLSNAFKRLQTNQTPPKIHFRQPPAPQCSTPHCCTSAPARTQPLPDQELPLSPLHKASLLDFSFNLYLVCGTSITLPSFRLRHLLLPDTQIQLIPLELGCCAATPWTQPSIMVHVGLSPRPICFSTPYVKSVC